MRRTMMIGIAALAVTGLLGLNAAGEEPAKPEQGAASPPEMKDGCPRAGLPLHAREAAGCAQERVAEFQKQIGGAVGLLTGLSVAVMSGLSLFALMALTLVTFPGTVKRVREGADSRPYFAPLLGGFNVLFTGLVVAALGHAGGTAGMFGGVILLAFAAVGLLGLAGKAQALGSSVLTLGGRTPNPVANLAIGWPVLYLVSLIPVVGWVLFAYWTISGIGGLEVSLFGRRKGSAQQQGGGPDRIVVDAPKYTV